MTISTVNTAITNADVVWQEDGLPFSVHFGDIYFSRENAIAETRHVFLEGNNLSERFAQTDNSFVIAECGFGSGLNFLCAWQLFRTTAPPGSRLYFLSAEQFPLTLADLKRFHAMWPELQDLCLSLQAVYPDQGQGLHRLVLGDGKHHVTLDLLYGDAAEQFSSLQPTHAGKVDAWFLDGFAPRTNPAMWSETLCQAITFLSHSETTLATYSVAALVKEGLGNAGFTLEKAEGFGNKRHMLKGRSGRIPASQKQIPALRTSSQNPDSDTVCIIGAGLAGCATAYSLAQKGIKSLVIEKSPHIAAGASGNSRGIMFLPLHREPSLKTRYLRESFLFARRMYASLSQHHPEMNWQPCGALQLTRKNSEDYFERVAANPDYFESLVTLVDENCASALSGITIRQPALHLPLSGTLDPGGLCQSYLKHSAISTTLNTTVHSLEHSDDGWRLLDEAGNELSTSRTVVIANSLDATRLLPEHRYPLYPNRGQLSLLRANEQSSALKLVLCGLGYISPAVDELHACGGSFNPGDSSTDVSASDDARNLELIRALVPAMGELLGEEPVVQSRAAVRCTTRDYLPLIGPVEAPDATLAASPLEMSALPGLYLFSGLGSHGITTSALGAEWLASCITGDPVPMESSLLELISPARFRWRELRKGSGAIESAGNTDRTQSTTGKKPA